MAVTDKQTWQLVTETVLVPWEAEKLMALARAHGIPFELVRAIVSYCTQAGPRCYDYAYKWIAFGAIPPE